MRHILVALLISLGLTACAQTTVGQAQSASNIPTLSPFVCEPPQLDMLSKEVVTRLRRGLCVQKDILETLPTTGAALGKAAYTFEIVSRS